MCGFISEIFTTSGLRCIAVASSVRLASLPLSGDMPMIDEYGALVRAALALKTVRLLGKTWPNSHRERGPSECDIAPTGLGVFWNARSLVHDLESFAENARTAEAVDGFLKISEAVVRHKSSKGR
jgi:hypothetical protein